MDDLMKLNGAFLHSLRIKRPLHFRPKKAQVVKGRNLYWRGIDADRRQGDIRRVAKAAVNQDAAHFCLRFSSICRSFRAVSTEVSTTFSPRYTRSTPAREITSDPWITTPEFSTWSRISRRETSSSPPSVSKVSKSFGIRDKRVRRPWPIYFDAPLPVPPLHNISGTARQTQAVGPSAEKFCGEVGRAAAHRSKWAMAAVLFCL